MYFSNDCFSKRNCITNKVSFKKTDDFNIMQVYLSYNVLTSGYLRNL
jgi:hypothetical protein